MNNGKENLVYHLIFDKKTVANKEEIVAEIPDNANSALRLSAIKCDKVVFPLPLSPTRTKNLGNLSMLMLFSLFIRFFCPIIFNPPQTE